MSYKLNTTNENSQKENGSLAMMIKSQSNNSVVRDCSPKAVKTCTAQ